jgi:hypothetical protein
VIEVARMAGDNYLGRSCQDSCRRPLGRSSVPSENILTYLQIPITNASAEGLNSKIQMIKYRARGYSNEGSFERAILFHCGGLVALYPTHPKS